MRAAVPRVAPAAQLAIRWRGESVLTRSYGWLDPVAREQPTQPDTLFDLASLTKLFVITTFMTLVEAGYAVYDSDTPAGADGDCVSVARARRMTIRAFSIQVLAAIHPPCGGCRIIVGCALAANDLSEQHAQGGGTGSVIQKRFVRGSATAAAYLASKAPNIARVSHRQRCAGVLDCTSGRTLLLGAPFLVQTHEDFARRLATVIASCASGLYSLAHAIFLLRTHEHAAHAAKVGT
jgi:hypothetical protein